MRSPAYRSLAARRWAALAVLALLWQALAPVAQAIEPRAWVTLCTSTGLRTLPVDDGAPVASAADHCVLCRLATAAGDVPLPPSLPRHAAEPGAHEATPLRAPAVVNAARCALPPSRAPPR